MKYVSIDIETTGLNPRTCQVLEIAAIVDDTDLSLDDCKRFHCFIDNGTIFGEPYALSLHSRIFSALVNGEGVSPNYMIGAFKGVLLENGLGKGFTVAGKNFGSFDLQFLKKLPNWDVIKMNYRFLDPSIMFWRPQIDGANLPNLKMCMERAGVTGVVSHDAMGDAEIVCQLIRQYISTEPQRRLTS